MDVSLKDRKCSLELEFNVSDVVMQGRLKWFGHLDRKSADDWVLASRDLEVIGVRGWRLRRLTWAEWVREDLDSEQQRCLEGFNMGQMSNLGSAWKK